MVLLAFTGAYTQIQQNQKMISQKLEVNDLTAMMQKLIMNNTFCDWQLRGPVASPFTINRNNLDVAVGNPPDFINLPGIFFGSDATAQSLAVPNQLLTGTTSQLRVQSVRFTNIVTVPGADTTYRGDLEVVFSPASMPMSLNPARAALLVSVNPTDPVTAQRITACNGAPSGGPAASGQVFLARHFVPVLTQGGVAPVVRRWFPRPLNQTIPVPNAIAGASLAGNRITLPIGTYRVVAYAVGDSVEDHIARFFNVTDNVEVALGSLAYASHDEGAATQSTVYGVFQVTGAPKQFELQQIVFRNPTSVPAVAMGGDGGFDVDSPGQDLVNNVFAFVEIISL